MIDTGVGSDVAKRVAAPLWGGLISLTILTLAVIPALYVIWRGWQLRRAPADGVPPESSPVTEAPVPAGAA
jgi:Cu(I)/Ag(I) efflux system membrane protein CusA/SilA